MRFLHPATIITTTLPLLPASTLVGTAHAGAATPSSCAPSRLLIVLDKSSSMNGAAGPVSKWTAARGAIDQVTQTYQRAVELGLATFPYPDTCGPGRIDVPPALDQGAAIHAALMTPPPPAGAYTPLGETLLSLAGAPALLDADAPAHLVLITDGFQWCSPYDPAARTLPIDGTEALTAAGVTTFVVGFGGGVDVETLDQMALVAGTARAGCDPTSPEPAARCYYQADDAPALLTALMDIAAVTAEETCDGLDNDCDGTVDEGVCMQPGADAGPTATADAGMSDEVPGVPGGCGCTTTSAGGAPLAGGLGLALAALPLLALLNRRRLARARPARSAARPARCDPARR